MHLILENISYACDQHDVKACLDGCRAFFVAWKRAAILFSAEWAQRSKPDDNHQTDLEDTVIEEAWLPVNKSLARLRAALMDAMPEKEGDGSLREVAIDAVFAPLTMRKD